jgi:hypothetical protein
VGGLELQKPRMARFRDVIRFIPVFKTKPVLMVPVQVRVRGHARADGDLNPARAVILFPLNLIFFVSDGTAFYLITKANQIS